jgi:hypothetical protein
MVTQRVIIRDNPELLALIRAARTAESELLLNDGESDVALVTPLGRAEPLEVARAKREQRLHRFLSAAGTWSDEDAEALKERVRAIRDASSRPLPDL